MNDVAHWVQWLIACLIIAGSLFALTAALGVAFLRNTFARMHPPALACTCGAWCFCTAALAYFSAAGHTLALYAWLIPVLLAIVVPISTMLIARAALFGLRQKNCASAPPAFKTQSPKTAQHS